jgi:outer membrane lipoprotein SlyB
MNSIRFWKIHMIVLFMVLIAEWFGPAKIEVGVSNIMLFPMLYALVIGTVLSIRRLRILTDKEREVSGTVLGVALMLFLAKLGVMLGPSLTKLVSLGPAFIMQEVGHFLGTIVLGLPIAMMLGMKREAIGATFSVDRDPNLALMAEKYGGDSPEFRGTFGVYLCGTLFGSLYLGVLAGWIGGLDWLDPLALAMASGVGSASMMAAASGAIAGAYPDQAQNIAAVAGAANLMTTILSPYVAVLFSLPITLRLYGWIDRTFRRKLASTDADSSGQEVSQ